MIGANVVILPGVRVGRCSVIGAGAVVNSNVEPYSVQGIGVYVEQHGVTAGGLRLAQPVDQRAFVVRLAGSDREAQRCPRVPAGADVGQGLPP